MSLHGMANFALFANYKRDCLNKYLLCVDMFNPLLQRLAICEDSEEMHYITVCLTNLNRLMTKNSFQLYKTKLEELMTKEILNKDTDKAIILKVQIIFEPRLDFDHFNFIDFRSCVSLISHHGH